MATQAPGTPPRKRPFEHTSPYLRALRVPVLFLVVALGLLAAYYSLYVSNNAAYLTGRNLRVVAKLGSQIETALADHEAVLSSFSTYYGADRFRTDFRCIAMIAAPFVPMFEYVSLGTPAGGPTDSSQRCERSATSQRSEPTAAPSTTSVVFTGDFGVTWARRTGDSGGTGTGARPFRVVMRDVVAPPFSHAVRQGVFDSVLLATTSGRVVHQEGAPDLRLTTLDRLVRKQSDGSWKELDFSTLPMTSQVLEVEMSGGRYFVYLQPCCAHLAADDGAGADAGLVVAGLIDAGTFRTASMAVSFSMMALMGAAIMAGIFSWPFAKLLFIGEGQRLRLIDVLLVGLCGLLWATLVTVAALDWYAYGTLKAEIDQQLQTLSDRIRENMREELTLAFNQLERLDRWASEQTKGDDRTPNLLSHDAVPDDYPFLESFSLINREGMQVRKWAAAGFATPRVSTLRREYFRHWVSPHPADPPYFLQSIRSVTTGNKEAVLSKPTALHQDAAVAAMTIPMISLTAAVLPPGFGFAVIDEEGQVLFHSDSSQRLDEQLFLETDRHRRLRAAVAARHAELMNVRYFGQDHRFYVAPLEHPARANWSLITFADKEPTRTVNIEWLVTTWLFALVYLSVYVLICIVILVWRPSYRASWMWPDASRAPLHQRLIGSYALFGAAFGAAVYSFRDERLLFVAWLLPFVVWSATYLVLARRVDVARLRSVALGGAGLGAAALMFWLLRSDVVPATVIAVLIALAFGLLLIDSRLRLRHSYVTAGMLLLLLTGVLPTLAFFTVAHAIQVESFIKYEQLQMARQLRVRSVDVGNEPWSQTTPETAQRASASRQRLSVYDRFFFGTGSCEPAAVTSVSRDGEVTGELPKPLEDLLPYYSEASVGMRELLHDRSSDDAWQWHRSDSRLVLRTPATTAGQTLCLQSSVPLLFSLASGGSSESASRIAKAVFLLCIVLLAVYWIVGFIARRIFLIDVVEPLWAQITTSIPMYPGSNLFIPWRAGDRKAQELPGGDWCLVDLARCPGGGTDADWFRAQRDRLEECPAGETVVIDHVEAGQGDPGFTARTLALITYALDVQHRTVVLVSALRLESLLRAGGDIPVSANDSPDGVWAATLRRFTVVDARFERTEGEPVPVIEGVSGIPTEYALAGRMRGVSALVRDVDCRDSVVNSVWAEVRRAAADRPALMPLNIEQLYEEVGDRLDNHYQGLWASCSDAEKLVLEHLARERLLNEKDRRTARVLMARGLIRKSPTFELADETMRRFVLSRSISAEIAELEQRSGSAWDSIRLPFLAALVATSAFFFLTQRELFTTTMAVITALAGGIPALVRVVGLFDGGSARSREG